MALLPAAMGAQTGPQAEAMAALPEVVVSATRTPEARRDVAASIDTVDAATLRQMGPQINLSEALQRVPGLGVLNRQNYAQDLQISSRGFGARSTFGVRGVRLYACPTGRARAPRSTWARPSASRCCAARPRRCTAMPRGA